MASSESSPMVTLSLVNIQGHSGGRVDESSSLATKALALGVKPLKRVIQGFTPSDSKSRRW